MEQYEKLREVVLQGGGMVTPFVNLSRQARIEKNAQALGNAEILGEALLKGDTTVRDYAKAMDFCVIKDSILQAHARVGGAARLDRVTVSGTAEIAGATNIRDSYIGDNAIIREQAEVYSSHIAGNCRVTGNAKLWNVIAGKSSNQDAFWIEGDAVLNFSVKMELFAGTRVHEGEWTRPPMVIYTPVFCTIEGVSDRVQIGCLNHSMSFWYKYGKEVLVKYGLEPKLYPIFELAMDQMRDFKQQFKSPKARRKKK